MTGLKGIVDHHTGHGHQAEQAHDGQGIAHDHVARNGPDHAEGDAEHDDKGLKIALKGNGQQGKYAEHGRY